MALVAIPLLCASLLLQAPEIPVAVLQSGQRIECIEAKPGDRQLQTPFGLYRCAMDPVVSLEDGKRRAEDLEGLYLDDRISADTYLHDLSQAGLLTILAETCEDLAQENRNRVDVYRLLEGWATRLDRVPAKVKREDRVEWLWKRANSKEWVEAVMCGAQLSLEVSCSTLAQGNRRISLAKLRQALKSRYLPHRRMAAILAGSQREIGLREGLMLASIEESLEPLRCAAARGAQEIHGQAARNYWLRNLARGDHRDRAAAAWNLGRYGGEEALPGLIHVLAAHGHKPPERFDFAGRTVWVVSEEDPSAIDLGHLEADQQSVHVHSYQPELEFLQMGSTFKVTRYGDGLRDIVLEALDAWAGEKTSRSSEAWLDWYLGEWLPSRT